MGKDRNRVLFHIIVLTVLIRVIKLLNPVTSFVAFTGAKQVQKQVVCNDQNVIDETIAVKT